MKGTNGVLYTEISARSSVISVVVDGVSQSATWSEMIQAILVGLVPLDGPREDSAEHRQNVRV